MKGDTNRILWVGTLDLELVRWSMMDRLNHTAWKQSKQSSVYPRFQFIPRLNWIFENLQGEQFLLCFVFGQHCAVSKVEGFYWNTSKARLSFGREAITTDFSVWIRYERNSRSPSAFDLPGSGHFLDTGSVCAVWKRLEVSACVFLGGEADIPRASACHILASLD